jgi:hypothetical protein
MDFKDIVKQLSTRIEKLQDSIQTEEATKNAFIMPFISALGYDVFNPMEVVPEYTCDAGIKKGEKIDYAILREGEPILLIECKHWAQDLSVFDNQLLRYFHVSKAKFGILTNGIHYKFYTDLDSQNKMDEKPFLDVDMLDLKDMQIEELKKFHKSYFDIETILSSASELKYTGELKTIIAKEFANPSIEFVKYFGKQIYDGQFTAKVSEQFTSLVKRSIASYISDMISDRLKAAIKDGEEENSEQTSSVDSVRDKPQSDSKVVTTEEEIEAFFIVKSILRPVIASDRITYRDAQSYFAILIDDNNRKTVCRLYLDSATNKKIGIMDANKNETVYKISSIDQIYDYSEALMGSIEKYK